eukprot:6208060-Pleurochrysis_carterae.AAC.1
MRGSIHARAQRVCVRTGYIHDQSAPARMHVLRAHLRMLTCTSHASIFIYSTRVPTHLSAPHFSQHNMSMHFYPSLDCSILRTLSRTTRGCVSPPCSRCPHLPLSSSSFHRQSLLLPYIQVAYRQNCFRSARTAHKSSVKYGFRARLSGFARRLESHYVDNLERAVGSLVSDGAELIVTDPGVPSPCIRVILAFTDDDAAM